MERLTQVLRHLLAHVHTQSCIPRFYCNNTFYIRRLVTILSSACLLKPQGSSTDETIFSIAALFLSCKRVYRSSPPATMSVSKALMRLFPHQTKTLKWIFCFVFVSYTDVLQSLHRKSIRKVCVGLSLAFGQDRKSVV